MPMILARSVRGAGSVRTERVFLFIRQSRKSAAHDAVDGRHSHRKAESGAASRCTDWAKGHSVGSLAGARSEIVASFRAMPPLSLFPPGAHGLSASRNSSGTT